MSSLTDASLSFSSLQPIHHQILLILLSFSVSQICPTPIPSAWA